MPGRRKTGRPRKRLPRAPEIADCGADRACQLARDARDECVRLVACMAGKCVEVMRQCSSQKTDSPAPRRTS
jgi:hypothetical protein